VEIHLFIDNVGDVVNPTQEMGAPTALRLRENLPNDVKLDVARAFLIPAALRLDVTKVMRPAVHGGTNDISVL
jgi:hypothetical protein